jgi:hypothetical protein
LTILMASLRVSRDALNMLVTAKRHRLVQFLRRVYAASCNENSVHCIWKIISF